jgi:hypothetical protein
VTFVQQKDKVSSCWTHSRAHSLQKRLQLLQIERTLGLTTFSSFLLLVK